LQGNRPHDPPRHPPFAIILQPICVRLDVMKWDVMGVFAPALIIHDGARRLQNDVPGVRALLPLEDAQTAPMSAARPDQERLPAPAWHPGTRV